MPNGLRVAIILACLISGGLLTSLDNFTVVKAKNSNDFFQQDKQKLGKVVGLVVNLSTGEALPNANIEVIETGKIVSSDLDGNFTLDLEPGAYHLRAYLNNFLETRKEIVVTTNELTTLDLVLTQEGAGEVIEVTANQTSPTISLLEERRSNIAISDLVSRTEISKDSSSEVAGVLQKVPGVSVVGNKFVYVRGLGDRYSNTVLNDALMPTPQPDRRVVPLDQVPSELVQSLKVLKSFTPDQPGEFAGGLVKIETLEFPNRTSLKISSSFSGNTQTTFQDFLTYPGSRLDFLGFGRSRRELPNLIPNQTVRRGSQLISGFSSSELQQFGRAFENVFEPRTSKGLLNQSYGAVASTQIGKLGLVGNLTYSSSSQQLDEIRNFFRVASDSNGNSTIFAPTRYNYDSGNQNVRLGFILNAAYKVNSNNKILLKNFFSNDATDETRATDGFFDDRGSRIRGSRLKYVQTRTGTFQLAGESLIPQLGNAVLNWRLTYSRATFDEPDLREVLYEFDTTLNKFVYFDTTQSGLRMFSEMRENIREPAFDLLKYFFTSKSTFSVKLGFSNINRDRKFNSRRFRFLPRGFDGVDRSASPENLYAPENITPNRFELNEDTRPTDFYVASQDITAGYFLGDYTRGKFRFIGGARIERGKQEVSTLDAFSVQPIPIVAKLDDTDILPSISGVYNFTSRFSVRTSYSKTVSRPQFRELSPFEFSDITGGRATLGNPNLKRARIRNFDIRGEWLEGNNLLSVGFFYKSLISPIEIVVEPTTALRTSFRNALGAENKGLEFEFRQNLAQISSKLNGLSLNTNYTFVSSNIRIGVQDLSVVTSKERPLAGQSRHLFNTAIDYDIAKLQANARLIFNYTGARISDVGTFALPDIVEKGYPTLDLLFSKEFGKKDNKWEIKLSGENLLNRLVRFKVLDQPFQVYRRGRNFSLGVSYTFF
ncbi:MAG: TonB-dependent receptor [Acidobacteria bacterium]|nr:TonB-dependent receptor [Acidobacteriota bacterium]